MYLVSSDYDNIDSGYKVKLCLFECPSITLTLPSVTKPVKGLHKLRASLHEPSVLQGFSCPSWITTIDNLHCVNIKGQKLCQVMTLSNEQSSGSNTINHQPAVFLAASCSVIGVSRDPRQSVERCPPGLSRWGRLLPRNSFSTKWEEWDRKTVKGWLWGGEL